MLSHSTAVRAHKSFDIPMSFDIHFFRANLKYHLQRDHWKRSIRLQEKCIGEQEDPLKKEVEKCEDRFSLEDGMR
jgi:hypothetical protein